MTFTLSILDKPYLIAIGIALVFRSWEFSARLVRHSFGVQLELWWFRRQKTWTVWEKDGRLPS